MAATYNEMLKLVDELAAKYPEAGLTFGYLGNCGRNYDDRVWYIFTRIEIEGIWGTERAKIYVGGEKSEFLTEKVHCFADGTPFNRKPTPEELATKIVRTIEPRDIEARLARLLRIPAIRE
jgi:hypothetical protein